MDTSSCDPWVLPSKSQFQSQKMFSFPASPDPLVDQHQALLVEHPQWPPEEQERHRGDRRDVAEEDAGGLDLRVGGGWVRMVVKGGRVERCGRSARSL